MKLANGGPIHVAASAWFSYFSVLFEVFYGLGFDATASVSPISHHKIQISIISANASSSIRVGKQKSGPFPSALDGYSGGNFGVTEYPVTIPFFSYCSNEGLDLREGDFTMWQKICRENCKFRHTPVQADR